MPRLSYPGGRKAAATPAPKAEDETDIQSPEITEAPAPEPPEVVEDPSEALRTQIEALRKSERDALTRAETAERKAQEEASRRETEGQSSQEQIMNSNVEALGAALAAAQSEAEMAEEAISVASQMQDGKGQAAAYRKLSMASAKILQLEQGKEAAERELQALRDTPKPQPQTQDSLEARLNRTALPYVAKQWLLAHSEYVLDEKKNRKISSMHDDLLDEGIEPYSAKYFEIAEQRLGLRPTPKPEVEVEDEPIQSQRRIYSAPPSREVPSSSGKREGGSITLTPLQKEAAKIAGITEKDYAIQVLRLRQEKMNGNYGGGQ